MGGGGGGIPMPLTYVYCLYYMALNAGIHKGIFLTLSVHVNVPINHNINNITHKYLTFIFYPVPTYTYL